MKVFERHGDELHIESSEKGLFVDISWGNGSFGGYDDWYAQFKIQDAEAFVRKFPSVTNEKRSITMYGDEGWYESYDFAVGLDDDGYFVSVGSNGGDEDIDGLTKENFNAIARGLVQAIKDCKAKQAKQAKK